MIAPTRAHPQLTSRQCDFLNALRDGKKTGKQMRGRLRRRGVRGRNGAFYRVMQRLKNRDLVKSEPVRVSEVDYQGAECFYELTDAGREVVGPKLELHKSDGAQKKNEVFRRELERVRACLG